MNLMIRAWTGCPIVSMMWMGMVSVKSKFSDATKPCCNQPKIQRVFHQKDANGKANSEDPDQTAPQGGV